MAARHTGHVLRRSLQRRQMMCPQERTVSRGASQHTQQVPAAAAPISLRAASMRRSVSTLRTTAALSSRCTSCSRSGRSSALR